jgi:putative peptidoglycan lipid II flippase
MVDENKNTDAAQKLSAKAAGIVSIAVMSSRLLGLIREQVFAGLFGASVATDAFFAAFRAPNLLRDLFAEGALSTAFITTFSKKITLEGDQSAWRLANKMATLLVVFMSGITLLGIGAAPLLMDALAHGFKAIPGKFELTVMLARIMFPFILMVSLAALVMGMLNAKRVFGMPAMASTFFNLGSIIGGVVLAKIFDPHFGTKHFGTASIVAFAVSTLIGGLLQLVVQFPALRNVGYRFRPDFMWRDEGVRQILVLMGPAVIAASAVQVNVMVNQNFASSLQNGSVSWLQYAFRLMQLPIGVFGVAIGTVTLPLVSRFASLKDLTSVRSTLARGIRLACLLTIPCAIGFWFFSEPIISLIFQRHSFGFTDMLQTSAALRFYATGLVAYSGIKVLAPAFYAIDRRNAPMVVSFISIITNYFLNQLFTFHLGYGLRGLALSTGIVAMINFMTLYVLMSRHLGGLETRFLFITLGKLGICGAALALICLASQTWWLHDLAHMAFVPKLIAVTVTISFAAAVFFTTACFLKIDEVEDVMKLVQRKMRRTPVQ